MLEQFVIAVGHHCLPSNQKEEELGQEVIIQLAACSIKPRYILLLDMRGVHFMKEGVSSYIQGQVSDLHIPWVIWSRIKVIVIKCHLEEERDPFKLLICRREVQ